jgi:hypothetical protein
MYAVFEKNNDAIILGIATGKGGFVSRAIFTSKQAATEVVNGRLYFPDSVDAVDKQVTKYVGCHGTEIKISYRRHALEKGLHCVNGERFRKWKQQMIISTGNVGCYDSDDAYTEYCKEMDATKTAVVIVPFPPLPGLLDEITRIACQCVIGDIREREYSSKYQVCVESIRQAGEIIAVREEAPHETDK